ncbi:MAG TPA: tetratricopeptide repeat protein [Methylorubrum populi]|uniref:Ancillary SecYEG translocon subunit n=1 Tax=Methylorubrum populi TaxID=223967 RepID=A0A921E5S0_9HYPH|nr:tetratricopeptide repeat protein [Methylorubrum populi]
MAENNEFIREVDEDYRRDQIAQIWKRYNALIITLAILLVAGVGGYNYWRHAERARAEAASERFDKANRLAKDGKVEEADRDFAEIRTDGPAGYALLARFRLAAETAKGDAAKGAEAYDKLAADSGIGDSLRDLARLRAALLRLDGADPTAALTSLQGLAAPTNAFRHTAREMLGLTALKRGDYEGAGRWFDQIGADSETPQGLRQRVEIYEALVAGGPVTVTEAQPENAAPPPPITR